MVQGGDVIGRRFRLVTTEEYDIPGATRFVAQDTRLDQAVSVDIISSLAPSSVVRAAHRAQVLRDRRLARIVAVGSERRDGERVTYVVSERPVGVRLDELLGRVVFLPGTAAALVGEASAILDAPLVSGTHHGIVRPRCLTVSPQGRVMLSGLGVEGELASQARLIRGRTERGDAIALARIFVTAVTAMDPDGVTAHDLPRDLTGPARGLCEALLRGSGPLTLAHVTAALGTGDTAALRALVAEATTLWWPPSPVTVADDHGADDHGADVSIDGTAVQDVAVEDVAVEEPTDPSSARLHTRFGGAVDDIDEFRDIVAAQNVESVPSVAEALLERLHRRFPKSAPLADLAAAAHRRAQTVAPFNVTPLLVSVLIVTVFVVAVVSAAVLTRPIDTPPGDNNNPSQTYPEYTVGRTPPSTSEG